MYSIEKKSYGYKLTFANLIMPDEMKKWVNESKEALKDVPKPDFGVFVDMRELKPLPKDSQQFMEEGQKLFKQKGMTRSAVILANSILTMQFKRLAKETGIYEWERYIDSSKNQGWEKAALQWIEKGIDPDK